jgi:hypothetical protein
MVAKRETLIDWTEGSDNGAAFRSAVGDSLWAPVLIDFGLTKRISSKMRLAFAKMVVSAELLDYGGVLDAYNVSMPFSMYCLRACAFNGFEPHFLSLCRVYSLTSSVRMFMLCSITALNQLPRLQLFRISGL